MEEIVSLIFQGCNLSKNLELNLQHLGACNPDVLCSSCDEIICMFSRARQHLSNAGKNMIGGGGDHCQYGGRRRPEISAAAPGDGKLQEWCSVSGASDSTKTMDHMLLTQQQPQRQAVCAGGGGVVENNEKGGRGGKRSCPAALGGGGDEIQPMDVSDSCGGCNSNERYQRRKDGFFTKTILLPAPRMGNSEIAPDDGYIWKKYGQKGILGSIYPRSYYKCTHQKLYNCPAKKQVQRLDDDPYTYRISYYGRHTCHMMSTAPPSMGSVTQETNQQATAPGLHSPSPPTSAPLNHWCSSADEINHSEGDLSDMELNKMDYGSGNGHVITNNSTGFSMRGGAGIVHSCAVQHRKEASFDQPFAEDPLDAFFNAFSSGYINMEEIFSSMEDI